MYQFINEVNDIMNELFENYNIKGKSLIFYQGRINKFFAEYMSVSATNKPLNAINYYDINTYLSKLECSPAEKVNHYSSLKRFFEYTYLTNRTKEIISQVEKPLYIRKPKEILKMSEYQKLKEFIVCRDNNLYDRLVLGLFLFTGLSRMYIASLRNNQFIYDNGIYKLNIWKGEEEIIIPLKAELQLLIHEYSTSVVIKESKLEKVIQIEENGVSTYISQLTKKIIGKKCTPTILSNMFVYLALSNGNYIWEVSQLTLESVSTIAQHIEDTNDVVNKQTAILNSF